MPGASSDRTLGRADAVVPITGADGKRANAAAVVLLSSSGAEPGLDTYALASNAALAPQATTPPVAGVRRGTFVWDAQWTGSGTLRLEALSSDGTTWRTVAELPQPGTYPSDVRLGANATVRLRNTNAAGGASLTGLYSSVS